MSAADDRWTKVADAGALRGPGPFAAQVGGTEVVLVRTPAGEVRAYEARCPHQGALLGEGEVDGDQLVCRNHRWRFDVSTGRRIGGPECLRACPLELRDGRLWVGGAAADHASPATPTRRVSDLRGPRAWPIVGSRAALDLDGLHAALEQHAERYGSTFRIRLGREVIVVTSEPATIQRVLRERPQLFRRMGNIEPIFRELGIDGVFSAEGRAWRPQRRLAMEALAPGHLHAFYPTLRRVAARLRRRWAAAARRAGPVDLVEDLKRFTVDVTTWLTLGRDLDTLEQDGDVLQRRLELVFPGLNRRLFATFPLWRVVRLPAERRLEAAVEDVLSMLRELVGAARARMRDAEAGPPRNFLEAMTQALDEEGRPYPDSQITGNAIEMLLAGEDTTALTLAWAVHELCDAPAARAALRAEADAVLSGEATPADLDAVSRLEVAGAVASETMRLRPVAPLFFFEANHDTTLGGVAIPAGQRVCLLTRPAARAEASFAGPATFAPERWLEAGPGRPRHDAGAVVPFGSGPRLCPGRSLALLEMRVVLATLARSFEFERVGGRSDVTERFAFTMAPVGLRVRLRLRPDAPGETPAGGDLGAATPPPPASAPRS